MFTFSFFSASMTGQCPDDVIFELVQDTGAPIGGDTPFEYFPCCEPAIFRIALTNADDSDIFVNLRLELAQNSYDFSNADTGPFSLDDADPTDNIAEYAATVGVGGLEQASYHFIVPINCVPGQNQKILGQKLVVEGCGTGGNQDFETTVAVNFSQPRIVGSDNTQTLLSNIALDNPEDGTQLYNFLFSIPGPQSFLSDIPSMDAVIHGELVIDLEGYKFREGSKIMLAEGASIVIQNSPYSILAAADSLRQSEVAIAIGDNTAISTSTAFEADQKTVNGIYLETIASRVDTFTARQKSDLLTIADQCIICGGTAVPLARSLYSRVDPKKVFRDELLCATGQQNFQRPVEGEAAEAFSVYPNPASNRLTVRPLEEGELLFGELVLLNNLGQRVRGKTLDGAGTENLHWGVEALPSGIYTLQLRRDNKVVHAEKVSILR